MEYYRAGVCGRCVLEQNEIIFKRLNKDLCYFIGVMCVVTSVVDTVKFKTRCYM